MKRNFLFIILGPLMGVLFPYWVHLDPVHPSVSNMAGISIWMALWWVTEAIPLAVTSLLPVVLFPLYGLMSGKKIAPIYFNHIIFLFIGGFLIALAMRRWNLHQRIAFHILRLFSKSLPGILFGFMAATAFLSMWISNTATTMMMVPIAMAILGNLEELGGGKEMKMFSKGLFLGIAYSASVGGMATLVGTPPNMAFTQILQKQFPSAPEISFASWMVFAFPLALVFFFILWALLWVVYSRGGKEIALRSSFFQEKFKELAPASAEEKIVFIVFVLMAFLWMTRRGLPLGFMVIPGWGSFFKEGFVNDGTVAILLSTLLFMIPSPSEPSGRIMDWKTAKGLPWDIVLLFGGGFALASGFKISGLSVWIGMKLALLMNFPPLLIIVIICGVMTFLTEFTSNTATTMMILPVLAGLSVSLSLNPLFLMIPATLSCSCAFMLPIATPPNAIVFSSHRLKVSDMAVIGFVVNLIGVLLISLYTYFFASTLLGIDVRHFPFWAGS